MIKWLLVIGVIAAIYFIFIKKKPLEEKVKTKKPQETEVNDLIKCETCGIYMELDDAILSNAKYYCSQECITKAKS
jgi:uncharacterized protein